MSSSCIFSDVFSHMAESSSESSQLGDSAFFCAYVNTTNHSEPFKNEPQENLTQTTSEVLGVRFDHGAIRSPFDLCLVKAKRSLSTSCFAYIYIYISAAVFCHIPTKNSVKKDFLMVAHGIV